MPPHASVPVGAALPLDYFNPGSLPTHVKIRGGQVIQVRERPECSLWAIAYWAAQSFRYERAALGADWVRVA